VADGKTSVIAVALRAPNRLAGGSKINGIRMEATNTNGMAFVSVKFCSVTTIAFPPLQE
jgi:hypothetical protein